MSDKFKNKYTIQSARLQGYDYSQNGMYFITICAKDKEHFFGEAEDKKIILSDIGKISEKFWQEIPKHFPFVNLDEFIVMPNHVHGIIEINWDILNTQPYVETQNFASLQPGETYKNKFGPQSKNLASIIRGFKIGVKKYAAMNNIAFSWQPRFYDHIVRNDESLQKIREYIIINPKMWERDKNSDNNLWM